MASLTEDAAVLGVVWFSLEHPQAAAAIAGVLLLTGLGMLLRPRPAGPPRLAAVEEEGPVDRAT